MLDCLFCKIINKDILAKLIFEDEDIMAFYDINPKADIHFLVIPKKHIKSMLELKETDQNLMGKVMITANQLAKNHGLMGYKVNINTGISGGQEVFHLHVHILGNK